MARIGWLVDGMNVIGSRPTGWWKDLASAIDEFAGQLRDYAGRTGEAITVVFDHRPSGVEPGDLDGIEVAFPTRGGRGAADDEIVRRVQESPPGVRYRVVTSDRELARRAREAGAEVVSSGAFRRRMDQVLATGSG